MSNIMSNKENGATISSTNAVEEIHQFFNDWVSVPAIYKTIAKAYADVNFIKSQIGDYDKNITDCLDYYMMLLDLLEKIINEKEDKK